MADQKLSGESAPEELVSPTYKKAFNRGYQLAKHSPELMAKLLPALQPTNEYFEGFISGREQFEKEKSKSLAKEGPAPSRDIQKSKDDREKDMDIERDEP